jgi:hypothetical protein
LLLLLLLLLLLEEGVEDFDSNIMVCGGRIPNEL